MRHRNAILTLAFPAALLLAACDNADMPDTARDMTNTPPADQARSIPRDAAPPASNDMARSTAPAPATGSGQAGDMQRQRSAEATPGGADSQGAVDRAGNALSDASVTAAVKAKLMKEPSLSAMSIDVDTTSQGAVTLSGEVKSATAKQRAEELARSTDGVRSVENRIVVRPA